MENITQGLHQGENMSKFGPAVDKEVRYTGLNMFKSFLGGMAFGALLMGLLLLPSTLKASDENMDRFCLAQNIYFESANQSFAGQIAVSHVVINRVNSDLFPDSICQVIYQSKLRENWLGNMVPARNQCQFSWYCDGKSDEPVDSVTWLNSIRVADMVLSGNYPDITEGSLWYHADFVQPYWSNQLNLVTTIDNHLFYK